MDSSLTACDAIVGVTRWATEAILAAAFWVLATMCPTSGHRISSATLTTSCH